MVGKQQIRNWRQSKGFTAVEALLIVLVLGILGLVGYYVYHAQKTSTKTDTAAKTNQAQTAKSSSNNQPTTTTSKVGDFTFSYPKSWTVVPTQDDTTLALSIQSPDYNSTDSPADSVITAGATVDVRSKVISSSLSDYMKGYGLESPSRVTIAGHTGLRIDTGSTVAIAFTKDTSVYSIEEHYSETAGATNPYPTVVDDIAASFKSGN